MGLTSLKMDRLTIRGRSLGGFYTGFHVPELGVLLDAGTALRSGAAAPNLFLSHCHADHMGSLTALLGMRGLTGVKKPLRIFMPEAAEEDLTLALEHLSKVHRWPLQIEAIPMRPGDVAQVKSNLFVRAFKTMHPVPSLGYLFFRRVQKLRPEFFSLPGEKIRELRQSGADIFDHQEQLVLGYATDTLPEALDQNPDLYKVPTLIVECTFLDERKSIKASRAGCHIHMDELLQRIDRFENEHVVLMHFSQLYSPKDVRRVIDERVPAEHRDRFHPFLPEGDSWWD